MKAYILCILIVTIINIINEYVFKFKNGKTKFINKLLFIIALLIPCIVAGARDITVGTDVRGYVLRLSNVVNSSSNFIMYMKNANSDILFSVLVYIGYFFKNFNFLLFVIELAVSLPVYLYAYLERDKMPFTINVLVFFLFMYCISLSMMRQSIAMSICILAFHFIEKQDLKKSIILIAIASMFHKTGIIFGVILIAFNLFNKKNSYLTKLLYIIISIFLLILVTPFIDNIIGSTMYANYLTYRVNFKGFNLMSLLKRVVFVILWLLCTMKNKNEKDISIAYFGLFLSIISLYCVYSSFTYSGMGRLGYYFFNLSGFLIIREILKKFNNKKLIMIIMIVGYTLLWWNMTCVSNDPSSVYPYTSSLIEFLN